MAYNGGCVVAMVGKKCVAIASDLRYGAQQQTIAANMPKVHKMHDKCFLGTVGLATDQQTLYEKFKFRMKLYELREERKMKVSVFSNLVATTLYEKRFGPYFCEPVICGLEGKDSKPYIAAYDLIGAGLFAKDFVLAGTCSEALYGMCESLYKPDLEPEDLFEVISQAMLSSVDRDALSGWGAIVHVITPEKIITRKLKVRQD
eukprot:TRINITY_DN4961_c0_g1_i1.p1 TRINITY_DN4961_c0_g1~~TRINITY_DN4961_c0_g1_i1.p1  ORF type:complete len:215 (+),score=30.76 TRINITY_DN4961_c0_g1_i1:39-647(+)